jgi:hypothetical protein
MPDPDMDLFVRFANMPVGTFVGSPLGAEPRDLLLSALCRRVIALESRLAELEAAHRWSEDS